MSFVEVMNSENGTFDCDFPNNHLWKFAWSKVKESAPDVYHLLSKLYLPRNQLDQLLQQHEDAGGNMTSQSLACYWLRQSRNVWLSWLPPRRPGKIPVYLGGMFPLSMAKDAVVSSPGILTGNGY